MSWKFGERVVEETDDMEVMMAVEETNDGRQTILADVKGDDAWLQMDYEDTATLSQWK